MPHLIIDDSYDVVFNPTASDWDNAKQTAGTAQKDILGVRYWLTKKAGSESYSFEGVGNYAGGVFTDIHAIYMSPEELDVLAHSPAYFPYGFDLIKGIDTAYSDAETALKNEVLTTLQYLLLKESSLSSAMAQAYTAMSAAMSAVNVLDFQNAYIHLGEVPTPTGSLTVQIKTDILSILEEHLKKYPR